MTRDRRRLARDKRGAGVAEYALLLFLVVAAVGITFKYMGRNVKRAGNKTEEQFAGGGSGGKSGQGAAGADSAGAADTTGAAGTAAGGGGGNATAAGGGGGKAAGGAAGKAPQGPATGGGNETADEEGTPIWKIIGGVVVGLFLIAGYFAFRKQKSSG